MPDLPALAGKALCLALALLLCGVLTFRPVAGYMDFWEHAAIGRWIVAHGDVPRRALFLWSADGPWVYHSWLAEVLCYGLTRLAGDGDRLGLAVNAVAAALVALTLLPAWALWPKKGAWALAALCLYLETSYVRFQPRPELFSMVLLAAELGLLARWMERPAGGRADAFLAAALVGLFALWPNLHPGVTAGLALLAATAACELAQARSRRSLALAGVAVLALLACLCNPYGAGYVHAYTELFGTQRMKHIQEWLPLWQVSPLPLDLLAEEGALAGLALLAWALNPGRRWAHLAWLLIGAALFATAVRNLWPCALVSLTVLAANDPDPARWWGLLGGRARGAGRPLPGPLVWAGRLAIVAWVGMELFARWSDVPLMGPLTPEPLEAGIVRFARAEHLQGKVFCDPENAAYLQWRFGGDPPLFIDGFNAYSDRVLHDYVGVVNLDAYGLALLNGDLDWVILTTNRPGPSLAPAADWLDASPRWVRAYTGPDGAVWARRTAGRRWPGRGPPFGSLEAFRDATFR